MPWKEASRHPQKDSSVAGKVEARISEASSSKPSFTANGPWAGP